MIRRCAYVFLAMGAFSLTGAFGEAPAGAVLQGNGMDQANPQAAQNLAAGKTPEARQAPPGGNPLWGIPADALTATRERPIFSASRRPPAPPPAPMPVAEAPPPPPPPPEHPPFTLVGTAIGQTQSVALILDQTTRSLVRLHVGEAASGWYLRSVELRTMTVEKNSQVVTVSFSVTGPAPEGPAGVALAARVAREF